MCFKFFMMFIKTHAHDLIVMLIITLHFQGYKANLESAATACDKCEAGTYQDRTGQTKCKDCAANYFSDKGKSY